MLNTKGEKKSKNKCKLKSGVSAENIKPKWVCGHFSSTIFFYIQREGKKAAHHNCSAEGTAPDCWCRVDTIWAGFGLVFRAEPCGDGAPDILQSSQSPGYKWAIWCHQPQLSLSASREQNILYPCCSSLCVQ